MSEAHSAVDATATILVSAALDAGVDEVLGSHPPGLAEVGPIGRERAMMRDEPRVRAAG